MKTAMQFLKEEIKNKIIPSSKENGELSEYQYSHNVAYGTVLTIIEYLLEKEKEQIIEANRQGRCNDCQIMYTTLEAQEYYNQNIEMVNGKEVTSDTHSNYQRGWDAAQRGLLRNDAWGDTYTDNANNRPSHEELDEWIKGWKAYRYSNEIAKGKPVAIQGHTFN